MDCCASIARALLILFNFIFWLCGAAILGIGIWFLADKDISSRIEIVQIDSGDDYFKYAAYLFIAFGAFVFIVGFAGMCGAIRGSKCLLGFYIFFVLLVIFAEIAAAVLLILFRVEVENNITTLLQKNIKERYSHDSVVRLGWDIVQVEFECCGSVGPADYVNITTGFESGQTFPTTCCVLSNKNAALEEPSTAAPTNKARCFSTDDTFYHKTGCKDNLKDWALKHSTIIIGVGIGIAVLEIFSIIWACCYCRNIGKDD